MLSKYSCDACRSRKIGCSRELAGCVQCTRDSRKCVYTRQGIIRRARKGRNTHSGKSIHADDPCDAVETAASGANFRSQLETDIDAAQETLKNVPEEARNLESLTEEYNSFWQHPSFIEMAERIQDKGSQFFTFEEEATSWNEMFVAGISRGMPVFSPVPPDILANLAPHPERVKQRAYLVLYYGAMLTIAGAMPDAIAEDNKPKLRWNLWLALNDARLLLEPSDINIEALLLLALHVQDFHTPSLCWMLVTTACRMLQALGITVRGLDAQTRERRQKYFWFLGTMDSSMAIIFGRAPSFHRAMFQKIPMLKLEQMITSQWHLQPDGNQPKRLSWFGAHFSHQSHLLGKIMFDIWYCLYDHPSDKRASETVKGSVEAWYQETMKQLNASVASEKEWLPPHALPFLEFAITYLKFVYYWCVCVLTRSRREWRDECLRSSREALNCVPKLIRDRKDAFAGVTWQMIYCPFTPFFVLFGDILSKDDLASKKLSLEAMENLPVYLEAMSAQHSHGPKLYRTSISLVQQARSMLSGKVETQQSHVSANTSSKDYMRLATQGARNQATTQHSMEAPMAETFQSDSILAFLNDPQIAMQYFNNSPWTVDFYSPENTGSASMTDGGSLTTATTLTDGPGLAHDYQASDLFMHSNFDWFAWDSNAFGFDDSYNPF